MGLRRTLRMRARKHCLSLSLKKRSITYSTLLLRWCLDHVCCLGVWLFHTLRREGGRKRRAWSGRASRRMWRTQRLLTVCWRTPTKPMIPTRRPVNIPAAASYRQRLPWLNARIVAAQRYCARLLWAMTSAAGSIDPYKHINSVWWGILRTVLGRHLERPQQLVLSPDLITDNADIFSHLPRSKCLEFVLGSATRTT